MNREIEDSGEKQKKIKKFQINPKTEDLEEKQKKLKKFQRLKDDRKMNAIENNMAV